jgi:hypothetical protein
MLKLVCQGASSKQVKEIIDRSRRWVSFCNIIIESWTARIWRQPTSKTSNQNETKLKLPVLRRLDLFQHKRSYRSWIDCQTRKSRTSQRFYHTVAAEAMQGVFGILGWRLMPGKNRQFLIWLPWQRTTPAPHCCSSRLREDVVNWQWEI